LALRETAAKSFLWTALESGSASLIAFVSLVVLAKLLQPSDFGVFSVSLATVEIAAIFTNMIFHDALVQRHVATESHFNGAFTISIVLSLFVYAVLWFAFPYLASLIQDERVSDVGRVLGLGLLVTGPTAILAARHTREFAFRLLAMRTMAGRLGGSILGIVSAVLGFGLWSLVIQHVAIMILSALTLLLRNPYQRLRLTTDFRPVGELLGYSIAAITALAAGFLTKRIFVLCVGSFLGTDIAGFFNLAFRLVDTVWAMLGSAVSQVLLPTLSRLQEDRRRLLSAYRASVKVASAILYPPFAALGVLAPEIIEVLFGRKWMPASPYVFMLSLLTFIQIARLSATPLLSTIGHVKDVCRINASILFYMVGAIALTRLPGDFVALAIWSGSEILMLASLAFALNRRFEIPISTQLGDILPPLCAALAMIASIHVVRAFTPVEWDIRLRLLEFGLTGALTYLVFLFVFGRRSIDPIVGMARVLRAKE
jgi:O-antigen/teichoic acid export membrane protein